MPESDTSRISDDDIIAQGELCRMVGFCLFGFSKIEESIAALYGVAAGIPSLEIAFKTHDEIREFQYRLAATDAVVRFWIEALPDANAQAILSKEWNTLHRITQEDSQERNRIAHFTLSPNDNDDGTTTWFVCPYFQFFSHLSAIRKQGSKFKIPDGVRKFDFESMDAKLTRFGKTANRIDKFIGGLTVHGAQLPK